MYVKEKLIINNFNNEMQDNPGFSLQLVKGSGDAAIIALAGTLSNDNVSYFMDKVDLLVTHGYYKIFFDMSNVQNVSAGGIGTLIRISGKLKEHGGCVILKHIPQIVLDIFQLPGFDRFFNFDEKKKFAHDCMDRREFIEAVKIWSSKHNEDIIRQ